jgi:hypothetical protein
VQLQKRAAVLKGHDVAKAAGIDFSSFVLDDI